MSVLYYETSNSLAHHGIKGQKWGVRRYQNKDGTLTDEGKKRMYKDMEKERKALESEEVKRLSRENGILGREKQYKGLMESINMEAARKVRSEMIYKYGSEHVKAFEDRMYKKQKTNELIDSISIGIAKGLNPNAQIYDLSSMRFI